MSLRASSALRPWPWREDVRLLRAGASGVEGTMGEADAAVGWLCGGRVPSEVEGHSDVADGFVADAEEVSIEAHVFEAESSVEGACRSVRFEHEEIDPGKALSSGPRRCGLEQTGADATASVARNDPHTKKGAMACVALAALTKLGMSYEQAFIGERSPDPHPPG